MAFSGFQDFNPDFSEALQQMIAARPGISIGSGYRTPERQAELYRDAIAKYGSEKEARRWVAPPGRSRHNMGIAADLAFATPEDRAWAHENAGQFGLNFRMGHEPWHIELINGKSVVRPGSASGSGSDLSVSDIPRPAETPFDPPLKGFRSAPMDLPSAEALAIQDVQTLANLMSPKRSPRAEEVLKRLRDYG